MRRCYLCLLVLSALFPAEGAKADTYVISLSNHRFSPRGLVVPANRKIEVTVRNGDNTPAQFGSWDLNREKALDPARETTLYLGPLAPGRYRYYDDYHRFAAKDRRDSTYGFITAK